MIFKAKNLANFLLIAHGGLEFDKQTFWLVCGKMQIFAKTISKSLSVCLLVNGCVWMCVRVSVKGSSIFYEGRGYEDFSENLNIFRPPKNFRIFFAPPPQKIKSKNFRTRHPQYFQKVFLNKISYNTKMFCKFNEDPSIWRHFCTPYVIILDN